MISSRNIFSFYRPLHIISKFLSYNLFHLPQQRSANVIILTKSDFLLIFIHLALESGYLFYITTLNQHSTLLSKLSGKYMLLTISVIPIFKSVFMNVIFWFNLNKLWDIFSGFYDFDVMVSINYGNIWGPWICMIFSISFSRLKIWVLK